MAGFWPSRAPMHAPSEEPMSPNAEPDSNKLLDDLLHAVSTEAYLDELPPIDASLSSYLMTLLNDRGLKRSEVFNRAGIGSTFGYYIFKGERGCGRDTAIKLAFGMGLDLLETQRLLTRAGQSRLWPKSPRDAVIIRALYDGATREQCDDELYELGFSPLMDD